MHLEVLKTNITKLMSSYSFFKMEIVDNMGNKESFWVNESNISFDEESINIETDYSDYLIYGNDIHATLADVIESEGALVQFVTNSEIYSLWFKEMN